jgi:hypothetical protein
LGLAAGPLLIDNLLLRATTLEISFEIGCAMTALSFAALLCLQETKSFVFAKEQSDEPLLMSTEYSPPPAISLTVIFKRALAGIRCIFSTKQTRAPGIVFFASLLTLQAIILNPSDTFFSNKASIVVSHA